MNQAAEIQLEWFVPRRDGKAVQLSASRRGQQESYVPGSPQEMRPTPVLGQMLKLSASFAQAVTDLAKR